MKINIKENKNFKEDEITLEIKEINPNIIEIINFIKNYNINNNIVGLIEKEKYLLDLDKIVRFYSNQKKTYATDNENREYIIKNYLYELEEILNLKKFIRISNSEIINIDYIESLDTSFYGSIKLKTKTGLVSYVSRTYLKNFKEKLGGNI